MPRKKNMGYHVYDYSQNGAYFVTICIEGRPRIMWNREINTGTNGEPPELSEIGQAVEAAIKGIPLKYEGVVVDKYVVMPNHFHMILFMENRDLAQKAKEDGLKITPPATVSRIIKSVQRLVTKEFEYLSWPKKLPKEHIIRSEEEYQEKWKYIHENPKYWTEDENY